MYGKKSIFSLKRKSYDTFCVLRNKSKDAFFWEILLANSIIPSAFQRTFEGYFIRILYIPSNRDTVCEPCDADGLPG